MVLREFLHPGIHRSTQGAICVGMTKSNSALMLATLVCLPACEGTRDDSDAVPHEAEVETHLGADEASPPAVGTSAAPLPGGPAATTAKFPSRPSRACLRFVPSSETSGEERIEISMTSPGCLSSSCYRIVTKECNAERDGKRIAVTTRFLVEEQIEEPCTRDCMALVAVCDLPLPPKGSYELEHEGASFPFKVPLPGTIRICEPARSTGSTTQKRRGLVVAHVKAIDAPRKEGRFALPRRQIARVMNGETDRFEGCYQRRLDQHLAIKGSATIEWTIAPSGEVTDANATGGTVGDAEVVECVLRTIRAMRFPRPEWPVTTKVTGSFLFRSKLK